MSEPITNYFQTRNFFQRIEETKEVENLSQKFYENCLTQCRDENCKDKKDALKKRLSELKDKCIRHAEQIEICSCILELKDNEIAGLKKKLMHRRQNSIHPKFNLPHLINSAKNNSANFDALVARPERILLSFWLLFGHYMAIGSIV